MGIGRGVYHMDGVNYLPEEVTDRLIPFPYAKAILTLDDAAKWAHQLPAYLIVAAVYLIVYCVIAQRRFMKSDL